MPGCWVPETCFLYRLKNLPKERRNMRRTATCSRPPKNRKLSSCPKNRNL